MSDEFPGGDDSASTSFQAWLDQQAENQGVTREELFEQLVSSYWTLNEMTQLLDDPGGSGAPMPPPRDLSDAANGPADADGPARRPSDRRGDAPTDASRRDERAGERRREDSESSPGASTPSEDPDERLHDRLEDLQAQLDALESEVDSEVEHGRTLDQLFEALADRLTEVERELDEVAATAESTEASLSQRIEALESDLTERQDALEAEHDQVESWLDTEFDSLRTILEYLLDRADELQHEVDTTGARRERELERLRAERAALQSIKTDAASHDAHEGECEACGETIDLDLLTRPYCPHCEASLAGVETERRLWLFTDTVVTVRGSEGGEGRSAPAAGDRSSPLPSRARDRERATPRGAGTDTADPAPGRERPREGRQPDGRDERGADAERPAESLDLGSPLGGQRDAERGSVPDEAAGEDRSTTTDRTAAERGDADDTGFEFGATTGSNDGDSSEAHRDAESNERGSPFGDLDDLRREENGADAE